MRLINTKTGHFEDFYDWSKIPVYAILSHTWAQTPEGEQTYQEVMKIQAKYYHNVAPQVHTSSPPTSTGPHSNPDNIISEKTNFSQTPSTGGKWIQTRRRAILKPFSRQSTSSPLPLANPHGSIWDPESGLSEKIRRACEVAHKDGFHYIWVDSSCIDKTSSSELSEAINSMFNWYRDAAICYAFLADVHSTKDVRGPGSSEFRNSRWFTRAWTLQELIAPRGPVLFLSQDWKALGTKDALADIIEEITHIDRSILTHKKEFAKESVANRMRWAAKREATRVEDRAYSLLGIFGITMPTLYGEGQYAFQRLQEEILRRIPDCTLFAWGECMPLPLQSSSPQSLSIMAESPIASSPSSFSLLDKVKIDHISQEIFESLGLSAELEEYNPTPYGIRTQLPFIPLQTLNPTLHLLSNSDDDPATDTNLWHLVLLGSKTGDNSLLGKLCHIPRARLDSSIDLPQHQHRSNNHGFWHGSVIFAISLHDLQQVRKALQRNTIYLPHPTPPITNRRLPVNVDAYKRTDITWKISLCPWTEEVLGLQEYTIMDDLAKDASLTLSNKSRAGKVHIQYRHIVGKYILIEARIWVGKWRIDEEFKEDSDPPYTSAIWAVHSLLPTAVNLSQKDIHLFSATSSRHKATLRLGLGIAHSTPSVSHFHTHVQDVTDTITSPSYQLSTRTLPMLDGGLNSEEIREPAWHDDQDMKITMLGSVKRMLESRGYSVKLDRLATDRRKRSDPYSLALSITSNAPGSPSSTISIKFYHQVNTSIDTLRRAIVVVAARVILESESESPSALGHSSGRFQEGPYIVRWSDYITYRSVHEGWRWCLGRKQIAFTGLTGESLTLYLGLEMAWKSEYYLTVDLRKEEGSSYQAPSEPEPIYPRRYPLPYSSTLFFDNSLHEHDLQLTLPWHIKRSLRSYGYEVQFEEPSKAHRNLNPYRLTLINVNYKIYIEYSRNPNVSEGYRRQWRGLSFQAHITTSSFQGSTDASTRRSDDIVNWDAWRPGTDQGSDSVPGGLAWELPQQDVTLKFPRGPDLTLRLGFYLVWSSEYCLTVEVNPLKPLPQQTSH